ncbi:hypothetical protein ACOSQ2_000870 [Xanthoceras sorbifolium]
MELEEIARRWAKLSLSDDDGPIAKVDEGLKAEGIRRLSLSLIGKLVSNREVNREAFRNTIASIWRTKSEVEVESIGVNLFVFRFGCSWDRKRVLEGGPWSFDKNLLVLKETVGIGRISEIDFSLAPFWIQIYNLPLACINRNMGLFLGGLIGPLKRGLRFVFGDGEKVCSALLCYERLPNFYFYCRCMGHLLRECHNNKQGVLDTAKLKFGAWLRAPSVGRSKYAKNTRTVPDDDTSGGQQGTATNGNKEQAADKSEEESLLLSGVSVMDSSVTSAKLPEEGNGPVVQQAAKVSPEAT